MQSGAKKKNPGCSCQCFFRESQQLAMSCARQCARAGVSLLDPPRSKHTSSPRACGRAHIPARVLGSARLRAGMDVELERVWGALTGALVQV